MVGHNFHKPGRPSHSYHSALMANTRLALGVEVMPGNESAPLHSMPSIWAWLDALPAGERPALWHGDIAYGNEPVLAAAEARNQPYLAKLHLTKNVRRLVTRLFAHPDWRKAGPRWQGREDTLQPSGWSSPRRVIVLRRQIRGDVLIAAKDDPQGTACVHRKPSHRCRL